MRVLRYEFPSVASVLTISVGVDGIITFGYYETDRRFSLWCQDDPEAMTTERSFRIVATGSENGAGILVTTCILQEQLEAWHLVEVIL